MGVVINALVLALAALLVWAAIGDWRTREIPNWLNAAIAVAAVPYWLALGLDPWPDMAIQLAIATMVFIVFAGCFAIGAMGGGDVKLITALSLWLPLGGLFNMLIVMAIAGALLTLAMLIHHRLRREAGRPEIPYGIAIAGAGLWAMSEPYLNHFS